MTPYKVILLGNSFAGKTSIINKYITGEFFKSRKETTQIDMLSYCEFTEDDQQVILNIWDTVG